MIVGERGNVESLVGCEGIYIVRRIGPAMRLVPLAMVLNMFAQARGTP